MDKAEWLAKTDKERFEFMFALGRGGHNVPTQFIMELAKWTEEGDSIEVIEPEHDDPMGGSGNFGWRAWEGAPIRGDLANDA